MSPVKCGHASSEDASYTGATLQRQMLELERKGIRADSRCKKKKRFGSGLRSTLRERLAFPAILSLIAKAKRHWPHTAWCGANALGSVFAG
jgi:hypothetical protein